ncbi:MAG TPA: glycosyltransferase family A protein [Gemmatimonadaceae bacterium]|nr:glycosyltransferase family A protein [Gemmatimonadaceae bacterium]
MIHTEPPEITVIIPTRAAQERRDSLRGAVESVLCQQHVRARVIVVLNGAPDDPGLARELQDDARVRLLTRSEASLPAALLEGLQHVQTSYFTSLDDDDHLLPGALKLRHAALERHPDLLVAVTNGYRRETAGDVLHVAPGTDIQSDPLRALLERNWMLPGAWLCRTTTQTRGLFTAMPRHLECTYLGARFSALGMVWIETPTVVYIVGSPLSASKSREYIDEQADALRQICALDLPAFARREFRRRIAAALHRSANVALRAGSNRQAWRWHLATLREPTGWRYLPFMRHLIRASITRHT